MEIYADDGEGSTLNEHLTHRSQHEFRHEHRDRWRRRLKLHVALKLLVAVSLLHLFILRGVDQTTQSERWWKRHRAKPIRSSLSSSVSAFDRIKFFRGGADAAPSSPSLEHTSTPPPTPGSLIDKLRLIRKGRSVKSEKYGVWSPPRSPDLGHFDFRCYQRCEDNASFAEILGDINLPHKVLAADSTPAKSTAYHSMFRRAMLNHMTFVPYQLDMTEVDYRSFYYVDRRGVYRLGEKRIMFRFSDDFFTPQEGEEERENTAAGRDHQAPDDDVPMHGGEEGESLEHGEALGMTSAGKYLVVSRGEGRLQVLDPFERKLVFDDNITQYLNDFNSESESFPLVSCAALSADGNVHIALQSVTETWTEVDTKIVTLNSYLNPRQAHLYHETLEMEEEERKAAMEMQKDLEKYNADHNTSLAAMIDSSIIRSSNASSNHQNNSSSSSSSSSNYDKRAKTQQRCSSDIDPPVEDSNVHVGGDDLDEVEYDGQKVHERNQVSSNHSADDHLHLEKEQVASAAAAATAQLPYTTQVNQVGSPLYTKRPKCLRKSVITLVTLTRPSDDDHHSETVAGGGEDDEEEKESNRETRISYEIENVERLFSSHFDSEATPGPQHIAFLAVDGVPVAPSSMLQLIIVANFPYSSDSDRLESPHMEHAFRYPHSNEQEKETFLSLFNVDGRTTYQYEFAMTGRCVGTMDPDLTLLAGFGVLGMEWDNSINMYQISVTSKGVALKHVATYGGMAVIADTNDCKAFMVSADTGHVCLAGFSEIVKLYQNPFESVTSGLEYLAVYEAEEVKEKPANGDGSNSDRNNNSSNKNNSSSRSDHRYSLRAADILGVKLVPMSHTLLRRPQEQLLCILTKQYTRFFKLATRRRSERSEDEMREESTARMIDNLINLGEGEW